MLNTCRSIDGNYYGLPQNTLIFCAAYNVDILEEVGAEPPTTWSEMREICAQVTIPGERYGLGWPMSAGIDTCYRVYPYMLKAGGRFLSDDLTTATWNDAAGMATMEFLLGILDDGSFMPGAGSWTGGEEWGAWSQGVTAFAIGGPWIGLEAVSGEQNVKLMPQPMPDEGVIGTNSSATLSDDIMITITRQSAHKDLAWEFVKMFRSAEADKMWLDPAMSGIPVNKASYEEPEWKDYFGHEVYQVEAEIATPWPYSSILGELHNEFALSVSEVWTGQKGLEEAFDEGVARCNDLLAEI
jgi:ABC-type glycerol-3-phosphate transport system substrate-binding protein